MIRVVQLDTSFLIRALVVGSREDSRLRKWIVNGESLAMSVIAWTEFLCGPVDEQHIEMVSRIVTELVPYNEETSRMAAMLFNQTGRRRGTLVDCMIASTAIQSDAQIATVNTADFDRFSDAGLVLAEI